MHNNKKLISFDKIKATTFRISDWFLFLFPFLIGFEYLLLFLYRIPFNKGISVILLFMLIIPATTAFGYFLNDVTDRNEDRLAGKFNVTAALSRWKIMRIFLIVIFFAIMPWFFLPRSEVNISFYSFQIFLLLVYSVPPLRLKRFPYPAVAIDALYNSVVPLLVIIYTFVLVSPREVNIPWWGLCFVLAWAFLKGLRGILLHLVKDRKNDKRANLKTFVLKYGPFTTIKLINSVILPAELLIFIAIILFFSFTTFPFLWLVFLLFGIYLFFFFRLWERKIPWRRREANFRYLYILNDLYQEWIPLAVLLYLPFLNPWYTLLIPVHFLLFHRIFVKFYRNFKINLNNYADYRKFLRRRKCESICIYPFHSTTPMLSEDNKTVHGLWIGNKLSVIELLTIKSFISNGHDFHLWAYETIGNLPEGVILRDANQIIPQKDIIVRKYNDPVTGVGKGSVGAPFSDIFRYKLLYEHGGWWVDMDVTCLKPLQFEEPYFFRNHLLLDVIGNVMKCPKGSELMLRAYKEAAASCDENTLDWLLPNKILNKHIRELGLLGFRKSDVSNKDEWPETKGYIRSLKKIPENWYLIHWSNEEWRMNGLDKEHLRLKNTTLGFLIEKYEVPATKAKFFKMLGNDLKLARPFRFYAPSILYASPINKVFWYFHGHIKWWHNRIRNIFKY